MDSTIIYDFDKNSNLKDWVVVDDVVMGGESSGNYKLNADGFGVFDGSISLAHNGGFSLLRYKFQKLMVKDYSKISIQLKGDGKKYQFRIKSNSADSYSYIVPFQTSGEWQNIEVLLKNMYPSFRGKKLNQPNFSEDHMEEVVFFIGNKKNEVFKLLLDKIELK
ncbi:CIA30 family protein [Mesonia ostreae]|uniref:CIA30 family protein n=1 Tax=Mesonia ostreae TaxID=861110 RepID=A0ABU2KKA9_9FLAO|nr:CIA30 family protein [Mesonia ostreae]MDT0295107.1 CIA30 family protein [Mesonia ostreae]